MQLTLIAGILEPFSYSLSDSASWALTSALQQGKAISFHDQSGQKLDVLRGVLPLLQPIPTIVDGAYYVLTFMKLETNTSFTPSNGVASQYLLKDDQAKTVVTLAMSGVPLKKTIKRSRGIMPVAGLAPATTGISSRAQSPLQLMTRSLANVLWQSEPINWMTQNLHLTSTGDFLLASEISKGNLSGGLLQIANQKITLGSGIAPMVVPFGAWRGAGATRARLLGLGSGSSSSCSSTSDSSSSSGSTTSGGTSHSES